MNEKLASQFKLRAAALAVASCLSMLPGFADAAGLGRITVFSGLGQPLRAEVEVSATRDEMAGMTARLAPQEAFRQASIEMAGGLSDLRFSLDKRPNGTAVIRVSSSRPVNEPFLDFLIELNWPAGRLVREYTFLLDPPEVAAKSAGQAVSFAEAKPVAGVADRVESEAAQPQPRPAPAERAARPGAEDGAQRKTERAPTHVVKAGETLRKIAGESQYEGVSLEQMLIGFLRANSDAFAGGNINRMRAGAILTVPDRETVAAIPDSQAKMEYRTQAANWNAYRQKLAAAAAHAPAREEGGSQAAGGKITAKVEDKVAAEAPKDQVKVTRSDATAKSAAGGRAVGEEELIAKDKALREAQERLAQLEKNLGELQKLVEMKNQSLAELQKQADAKGKEAPAVAAKPVEPPKPAEAPKPAEVAKPVEAPKPVEEVAKAPATAPEMPKPVAPAAPKAAAPKVAPPPVPAPAPETSFLDDETLLPLAGGGAIAALLAAYLVLRRRRSGGTAAAAAAPQPFSMAPNSVFRTTGGQSVDTSATTPPSTDFSQTGPGTIDTDEVDPVAEADVYMAYGRDAQAEEILLEAMQKDPQRTAIHVKLLEIYAARKSLKQFDTLASELYSHTGGLGPDWEKVAAMGAKLDPANPLYSAAAAPTQPGDADATLVAMPEDVLKAALAEAPVPATPAPTDEAPELPALDLEPAALAIESEPEEREDAAPVHLDFDLGEIAQPAPAAEAPKVEAEAEKTEESVADALDFDLGPALETQPLPVAPPAAPAAEPEPVSSFDFDFDLGEVAPQPAPEEPEEVDPDATLVAADLEELAAKLAPPVADEGVIEFDIDIGQPEQVQEDFAAAPEKAAENTVEQPVEQLAPEVAPEMVEIAEPDHDALEFDLQLSDSTVLGQPVQMPGFDLGAINLDLANEDEGGAVETLLAPEPAAEEILRDAHWEEVNTKLDLAKAYEEMGDLEGARELLQEVLQEGSPDLVEQAQAILGRLNA